MRFVLAAVQREGVDRRQATVDRLIAEGKSEADRADYLAKNDPNQVDDAGVQVVLQRQAKMRRDSIDAFRKGERPELVAKEEQELAVISGYLPQQLSEAEVRAIAERVVAETGASGPRDMGKVMPKVLGRRRTAPTASRSRASSRRCCIASILIGPLSRPPSNTRS